MQVECLYNAPNCIEPSDAAEDCQPNGYNVAAGALGAGQVFKLTHSDAEKAITAMKTAIVLLQVYILHST